AVARGRVRLLRIDERRDPGPGDATDRPLPAVARPGRTVPADGEPGPEGAGVRDPGPVVALPGPRGDGRLEAEHPPANNRERGGPQGRGGRGRAARPGRAPQARDAPGRRPGTGPVPPPHPFRDPPLPDGTDEGGGQGD